MQILKIGQMLGGSNAPSTAVYENIYSLDFDGVDDYVDLGDSNDFSFGNGSTDTPFSLSFWYKSSDLTSKPVFTKTTTVSAEREYYLYFGSGDKLVMVFFDYSSGGFIAGTTGALTSTQGAWTHASITYDGSGANTGIEIYINGVLQSLTRSGSSYTAMENTSYPLWVGGWQTLSSYFLGNLDEISLWSKELSLAEVVGIYNSGDPTNLASESGLIGYWRNGDTAGTSVYPTIEDYSSNSNDGTMTNMASGDIVTVVP